MKWQATIESVNNGYEVSYKGGDFEGKVVFQEKENYEPDIDKSHVVDMLYDVLEYFGVFYSKHNKKNITIKYE